MVPKELDLNLVINEHLIFLFSIYAFNTEFKIKTAANKTNRTTTRCSNYTYDTFGLPLFLSTLTLYDN